MTSDNDLAQFAPRKYEEAVGTISIGWGDLDHDADKIPAGVGKLSLNDLFGAVKSDVGKLPEVQLPRAGRNRLHLNQCCVPIKADRHDIVRWHVASERRGDESAPRQFCCDEVLAGLLREVVAFVRWPSQSLPRGQFSPDFMLTGRASPGAAPAPDPRTR